MKLINSSYEIIPQEKGLEGIYKQIEIAGRTCYKSESKIEKGSAEKFTNMMINSGHGAMLEAGTVYLKIPVYHYPYLHYSGEDAEYDFNDYPTHHCINKYSKMNIIGDEAYITTNLRVLVENNWMDDLQYLCEPTEYHEKRITVKFTCDIGVSREANRHRVNSMAEQSTRYCNFTKNKFGNELTIIQPDEILDSDVEAAMTYFKDKEHDTFEGMCGTIYHGLGDEFDIVDTWMFANLASEWSYNRLIKLGWKPEQARRVLPLDLKTELVHTAFVSDWEHFFSLRCDRAAHPDIRKLAISLKEEFKKIKFN